MATAENFTSYPNTRYNKKQANHGDSTPPLLTYGFPKFPHVLPSHSHHTHKPLYRIIHPRFRRARERSPSQYLRRTPVPIIKRPRSYPPSSDHQTKTSILSAVGLTASVSHPHPLSPSSSSSRTSIPYAIIPHPPPEQKHPTSHLPELTATGLPANTPPRFSKVPWGCQIVPPGSSHVWYIFPSVLPTTKTSIRPLPQLTGVSA